VLEEVSVTAYVCAPVHVAVPENVATTATVELTVSVPTDVAVDVRVKVQVYDPVWTVSEKARYGAVYVVAVLVVSTWPL